MAHFANIDSNGIVTQIIVISNEVERRGQEFINQELKLPGTWVQTSYNTRSGKHKNNKSPFRKNYAGIGYTYDAQRDAFIPPKPYPSWILNEDTCQWRAPVSRPLDNKKYVWDENTVNWKEIN